MSDDTVPQFGRSLREEAQRDEVAGTIVATRCPTCGAHFSPDGRFCPFDGTLLVPAVGWDPAATDGLVGSVIDGRYEVQSVLGEGGMGTVYRVRHRALGKPFALKALRKELASDGEIAARFIQEARTAAAASHPGLVEITDFGRLESGQVYFVMELLEGQSLATLIRSEPLPAQRGLAIVRQLAHALKAAHDCSIVHRDLKPDNVLIGRGDGGRDAVKIVDFGLAKVIGASKLTRSGVVFGTPHYMSPEQAAGEVVDHRADIYALGVVMYEMFTGQVPFEADSYMGVLSKHINAEPAPPSELRPELKELGALEQVILRCLHKLPSDRYDSLAELLEDLDQGAGKERRSSDAKRRAGRRARSTRSAPARPFAYGPPVIVGGAFLLGMGLVLLLRRSPAPAREALAASASAPVVARITAAPPAPVLSQSAPLVMPAPSAPPLASAAAVPTRKPVRPAPLPSPLPSQKIATPAVQPPMSSEIVDPWAR